MLAIGVVFKLTILTKSPNSLAVQYDQIVWYIQKKNKSLFIAYAVHRTCIARNENVAIMYFISSTVVVTFEFPLLN